MELWILLVRCLPFSIWPLPHIPQRIKHCTNIGCTRRITSKSQYWATAYGPSQVAPMANRGVLLHKLGFLTNTSAQSNAFQQELP